MTKSLTARRTSAQIESVIVNAEESIFPVPPYVSGVSGTLFQSIRARKKVPAHRYLPRIEQTTPELVAQLGRSSNPTPREYEPARKVILFNEGTVAVTQYLVSPTGTGHPFAIPILGGDASPRGYEKKVLRRLFHIHGPERRGEDEHENLDDVGCGGSLLAWPTAC